MREKEYAALFNGITDVIETLKELQRETESMAIEDRQTKIIPFE